MKAISYGYQKSTRIGYIEYKPDFIEKLFGVKEIRREYKLMRDREWLINGGLVWVNLLTGKETKQPLLDCAVNLTEI